MRLRLLRKPDPELTVSEVRTVNYVVAARIAAIRKEMAVHLVSESMIRERMELVEANKKFDQYLDSHSER